MKKQALITYYRKSKSRYQKRSRDRYAKYFESLDYINNIGYTNDIRNDNSTPEISYQNGQHDNCNTLSNDIKCINWFSSSVKVISTQKNSSIHMKSVDPYLARVISHFPYWEMNVAEQAYHIMVDDIKNRYPLGISDMDYLRELRRIANHLTSDW